MPHKLKKTRKLRGSRTHGWGQVGQHRKHGMKGGRGKAGMHKHRWTYTVKYEPDHFIKKGFRDPAGMGEVRTINIKELDQLVETLSNENKLKAEDGKYVVNLADFGYKKLLGTGRLTKPLVVKTDMCSESAARKIQDSGGQLIRPKS